MKTDCERDEVAENCEIEITTEMIRAGAEVLLGEFGGRDLFLFSSPAELAERVCLAMCQIES